MSNKFKRKGKSKFIMIDSYVKRSPAWKALTPVERAVYIEVKWRYDGVNNGRIGLGLRELAEEINMGRDTAGRALDALVGYGFIVKTKASAFNVKNRAATEWRLTEYTCDVTGELPTKTFMKWEPKKKQQSHASDTQSHASDCTVEKVAQKSAHSRTHRTVMPIFDVSQSHPSDTYIYTTGSEADTVTEYANSSGSGDPFPKLSNPADAKAFVKAMQIPSKHMEIAIQRIMSGTLFPRVVDNWKREAKGAVA
ncbi:hypothetical protein ACI0FM_07830 [Paenochrobactrum sp. BZR 588]|uniref:hypothetical protein n=1 Tax=unclassified Paenochrobactrum TaxID=2639760 RepID=UPI0038533792